MGTFADLLGDVGAALDDALRDHESRIKALEEVPEPPEPEPGPDPGDSQAEPPNLEGPGSAPSGSGITPAAKPSSTTTLTKFMDQVPEGNKLSLGKYVWKDPDCNRPSNYAVYDYYLAKPTAILGSGADFSILELPPETLSQGYKKLDDIVSPDTNPYYIVRTDNATLLQDFTVRGTFQGKSSKTGKNNSFHGLQLYETDSPTLKRIRFINLPGPEPIPPHETFAVFGYNITGTYTCEDIEILSPDLEGSSGISCQARSGATLTVKLARIKVLGHPNGSGWTIFNTKLTKFEASDFFTDGCLSGLNFEHLNVNGGARANNAKDSGIVLTRIDIRNPSGVIDGYSHISIDASAASGGVSNRVDIHDPVGITTSHKFGICVSKDYGFANVTKGPQAQRGDDIHLWMGGEERSDLIWWTRTAGAETL